MLTESQVRKLRSVRYPRKFFDGGGLYLLVAPNGGRYWRYNYRFNGKHKTLALGIYPDVPLAKARTRHLAARQLLAEGIDPSAVKKVQGKSFGSGTGGTVSPRRGPAMTAAPIGSPSREGEPMRSAQALRASRC